MDARDDIRERALRLGVALNAYVGRWVAVRDDEIVADGETYTALVDKIGTGERVGVFLVPPPGPVF